MIYVVWPEGLPAEAKMCRSWLSMQCNMLGLMGLYASVRGRRMSRCYPVTGKDHPIIVARQCERVFRSMSK